MKVSQSEKQLLLVLGGLLCFILLYFFAYTPLQEQTEQKNAEIATLAPEVAQLEDYLLHLDEYEQGIIDYATEIDEAISHYPNRLEDEDELIYLLNMKNTLGLDLFSVGFDDPSLLMEFPCRIPSYDGTEPEVKDIQVYRTGTNVSAYMSYQGLKQTIDYLYNSYTRTTLDSLTVDYDMESGKLLSTLAISKYYIEWEGVPYMPSPLPDVSYGTYDPFGSS